MQVLLDAAAADAKLAGDAAKAPAAAEQALNPEANGAPDRDAAAASGSPLSKGSGRAGIGGGKLDALSIEWDFTHHAYYPVLRLKNIVAKK